MNWLLDVKGACFLDYRFVESKDVARKVGRGVGKVGSQGKHVAGMVRTPLLPRPLFSTTASTLLQLCDTLKA